jgi:hypothetical protein
VVNSAIVLSRAATGWVCLKNLADKIAAKLNASPVLSRFRARRSRRLGDQARAALTGEIGPNPLMLHPQPILQLRQRQRERTPTPARSGIRPCAASPVPAPRNPCRPRPCCLCTNVAPWRDGLGRSRSRSSGLGTNGHSDFKTSAGLRAVNGRRRYDELKCKILIEIKAAKIPTAQSLYVCPRSAGG